MVDVAGSNPVTRSIFRRHPCCQQWQCGYFFAAVRGGIDAPAANNYTLPMETTRACHRCAAPAAAGDTFCHRCGTRLTAAASAPATVPAAPPVRAAAAPPSVTPAAAPLPPPRAADLLVAPTRLFTHGTPPTWGVALALAVLVGVLGTLLGQAGIYAVQPHLDILLSGLPAAVRDQVQGMLTAAGGLQQAGQAVAALALAIPTALGYYLLAATLFYALGRWVKGTGEWQVFARWYALLELPLLLIELAKVPLLLALLLPALSVPLLGLALLAVLGVQSAVWLWRCWLRYALLRGCLALPVNRAAGIVIGFEAVHLLLLVVPLALLFGFAVILGFVAAG